MHLDLDRALISAHATKYVERYGSMISEAGGVVLYAMNVDTAAALAGLLMAQDDAGWKEDGNNLHDRCERVRVLRSLLGLARTADKHGGWRP